MAGGPTEDDPEDDDIEEGYYTLVFTTKHYLKPAQNQEMCVCSKQNVYFYIHSSKRILVKFFVVSV